MQAMKLQKNLAYKYKNKEHYKHVVVIPRAIIDELGWLPDIELEPMVREGNLVLQERSKNKVKK